MPTTGSEDYIADDELLLRKIPVSKEWFDRSSSPLPAQQAFHPNAKRDISGISLSRLVSEIHPGFLPIKEFANGPSPQGYYVAVLRVSNLRAEGVEIKYKPVDNDPGHVELPQLNSGNRRTGESLELEEKLANMTIRVEGPFTPHSKNS